MQWFRWYHGTVDDRKWLVIARHSGQNRAVVLAVWCALLEFASQADDRGSVAAFDCESLDVLLGVEDGACAAVLRALAHKGLIVRDRLTAWDRRQPRREDESAVERQRRRRERLRLPPALVGSPEDDLSPNPSPSLPPDDDACADEESVMDYPVIPGSCAPCHAASRSVAQAHAPEKEKEKKTDFSPPSPPYSPSLPAGPSARPPSRTLPPVLRGKDAPSPAASGDMGFQQLVDAYPAAHVAPRAEALDIWRRLGRGNARPGLPRLLQALALWRESALWRKEEGRYIPKLANFLRRRMWEDAPSASGGEDWDAAEARQRAYRARMNALLQELSHG